MTILTLQWVTTLRIAVGGFAAVLLIGCGQQSPETLMASAKEHLAKGDRSAAVIQLKNLLTRTPGNGEARLMLGEALLEAEDFVAAEKELGRALELKQPHEKVLPLYVRALLAQGKNEAVVTEVDKYKLYNPPAVAATQTALGDALMEIGNRSRAREAYKAAVAAVPGYPRARLGEARHIALEGRLDEAMKQTEEVISAEPKLAEARGLRADLLLAKGDREGAKKALQEAIAANHLYLPARLSLISMLTDERDFDGAEKLIESTRKEIPRDLRIAYLDASLAFRKGNLERARQQVEFLLKLMPDHLPSLVLAGAVELKDKRLSAAEVNLRKAIGRAPSHAGARLLLVQTYLQMGQPVKAKETLQPLIERGVPNDARLLLVAAETFLANGDVQRAITFYQAAAKGADAQQVVARTRLGEIALATGRSQEGFRELEAVSLLDAGVYQADLALIAGHLRRKEFDKAMEAVQGLEKKQPKNPLTYQLYGVVNLAKGNHEAARKGFERALELQPVYMPAAYNLAQLDFLAKKPEDARRRYEAMIAKEPNNEQPYLALAELQARTGASPKDIGATLQRAVRANPQAPAPRLALVSFQLQSGETRAALTAAQEALAAMPSDPQVVDIAGVAQEAAGEVNQAIETYNKLASLQPQAVQPLHRLVSLYIRKKDAAKAIESLRRIQKIAPRERDVVPKLVEVYVAAGRYDDALKEARELQKREPNFAGGYSLEGDVYLLQHKFADAERMYRQALKVEPRANAVAVKMYGALSAAGTSAAADAWGKKWMADNPKDAAMRIYLGERELAARNLKASAAHFQAAIAIEPSNALVLNNLAFVSGELNDAKALGYAEQAVKLAPSNADVLDTYGMLLMKKGEADKALSVLDRARKLAPARSDLRVNYAKALIKAGKKDDARKELEALTKVTEAYNGKDEVAGLLKSL